MKLTVINDASQHPAETRNKKNTPRIFRLDFFQIIPMCFLLIVGLFYVYSTGQQIGGNPDIWKKQLFFILCGFTIWGVLAYINYKLLAQWAVIIYAVSVITLVLVLMFGVERYGAKRWFSLFGLFSVQPSEFAKTATLILAAWILSLRRFNIHNLKHLAGWGMSVFIPFYLIYKEPDLGSSIILFPATAAMLFVARIRWKWIIIAAISILVMVPIIYPRLHGYQKERILVFLDPSRDPTNKGWNSRQSQLAVGSGGLFGKGIGKNTQSTLGFLPKTVANSDFIFSVIAEETGFIGSSIIIFCYILLLFSAFRTAIICSDPFGKYLAVGIGVLIFIHSTVNIGMTIRLMPVTGLPLPLVSLGGSFIVSTMLSLGIIQSIYIRSKKDDS